MRSFRLGSVLGIEIRIDISWFIIFFLLLWTFSQGVFPEAYPGQPVWAYYAMALAAVVLFFASLLAHELSHSVVARRRGVPVDGITLFIFGGMARTRMEPRRAGDEFVIAGVGPLASVLIGVLFGGVWLGSEALGLPVGAIPGAASFGQPTASTDGVPQRFSFDPLRQHYLFATYNKPRIKDDFTAQLVLIADLADLSTLWVPSLAWSATEWLTITALGFIPAPGPSGLAATRVSNGAHVSEYTLIPMDYRFFLEARLFY